MFQALQRNPAVYSVVRMLFKDRSDRTTGTSRKPFFGPYHATLERARACTRTDKPNTSPRYALSLAARRIYTILSYTVRTIYHCVIGVSMLRILCCLHVRKFDCHTKPAFVPCWQFHRKCILIYACVSNSRHNYLLYNI